MWLYELLSTWTQQRTGYSYLGASLNPKSQLSFYTLMPTILTTLIMDVLAHIHPTQNFSFATWWPLISFIIPLNYNWCPCSTTFHCYTGMAFYESICLFSCPSHIVPLPSSTTKVTLYLHFILDTLLILPSSIILYLQLKIVLLTVINLQLCNVLSFGSKPKYMPVIIWIESACCWAWWPAHSHTYGICSN